MNWALTILFGAGLVFATVLLLYLLSQAIRGYVRRNLRYALAALGALLLWVCVIVLNAFAYFGAAVTHGGDDHWVPLLILINGPLLFGVGFAILWVLRWARAQREDVATQGSGN